MHVLSEQQMRRNRRRLGLLLALLMTPFILAWIMVRFEIWLPDQTINQGQLIRQPEPIHHWPLLASRSFPEPLKQHWLLVLVTPQSCQSDCGFWQNQLQQIHKALGKEGKRVRRVLLQPEDAQNPLPEALAGMGAAEIRRWHGLTLSSRDWLARPWLQNAGYKVLLVDPAGNLVTGYAESHSGRDLLRDLRRLLKASAAG